ncbi:hypothetical protein CBR_g34621 [Chara braunii]|uniref:Uncharacterized protein n=1 Tax=Chara braunii TaxID=69332 RepID=A0A388LJ91_CHABU|nr:hypothetical protein CBR_g34621 [Chara braunii]|eukprot:GBG82337.1 hypothetical protein CBR_g34621 [Chara braunii]
MGRRMDRRWRRRGRCRWGRWSYGRVEFMCNGLVAPPKDQGIGRRQSWWMVDFMGISRITNHAPHAHGRDSRRTNNCRLQEGSGYI